MEWEHSVIQLAFVAGVRKMKYLWYYLGGGLFEKFQIPSYINLIIHLNKPTKMSITQVLTFNNEPLNIKKNVIKYIFFYFY